MNIKSVLEKKPVSESSDSESKIPNLLLRYLYSNRFEIIILIILIPLMTGVGKYFQIITKINKYNAQINLVSEKKPKPILSNISDKMTPAEYKLAENDLVGVVIVKDPKAALDKLQSLTNIEAKNIEYCHGLTHEIGHAAYKKYGFSKALEFQDDICGSGYTHGVIESYFTDTKDLNDKLRTVCQTAELSKEEQDCYHGIGHGVMFYTTNDIPKSLIYCDSFIDLSQRSLCSEGVFMENFNSDIQAHPSKYLDSKDPSYPCALQTDFYKDACYFYTADYYLHLHTGDYMGAIKWCDSIEDNFIAKCDMGVGSRTMKYNLGNPNFVTKVCLSANVKWKVDSCIDGMISYFLVQYNSVSSAKNICSGLPSENQSACYDGIDNRSGKFLN